MSGKTLALVFLSTLSLSATEVLAATKTPRACRRALSMDQRSIVEYAGSIESMTATFESAEFTKMIPEYRMLQTAVRNDDVIRRNRPKELSSPSEILKSYSNDSELRQGPMILLIKEDDGQARFIGINSINAEVGYNNQTDTFQIDGASTIDLDSSSTRITKKRSTEFKSDQVIGIATYRIK